MTLNANTTVRELALTRPEATRIFERLQIDYCCGGHRTLDTACADAGLEIATVMQQLAAVETNRQGAARTVDQFATLTELIEHITTKHHTYTKTEMERLTALLTKVCAAHSARHLELLQASAIFQHLCADLQPHMLKEELVLFPYITRLEAAVARGDAPLRPPFGTVNNPVRMMMYEHDTAGALLRKLRATTNNYAAPADACLSYQTLYGALADFAQDLHQHIHLENNLLFPRAIELEEQAYAR
ncbi:MAG TPA: iron-sulfur cluster repair di-iron protein [Pyrinomonadaceae bacterium]|nr:iron-sulfur cluster repair di-iron protein [Pyrinomonadaceae bacterium]